MRAKEVEPIVGVEKKPDGAGGWLMEEKVNPPNPEASPTMEFTEFARFPISRGEKFSGKSTKSALARPCGTFCPELSFPRIASVLSHSRARPTLAVACRFKSHPANHRLHMARMARGQL
jgi:hypothetical protein